MSNPSTNATDTPTPAGTCASVLDASPTVTLHCQKAEGHEDMHEFSGELNGKKVDAIWTTDKAFHQITQGPLPVGGSQA